VETCAEIKYANLRISANKETCTSLRCIKTWILYTKKIFLANFECYFYGLYGLSSFPLLLCANIYIQKIVNGKIAFTLFYIRKYY
jgi:hypothetical protein